MKDTKESFIKKAELKHNNFYSYPNTVYINSKTKVKIECSIHGEFEQTPAMHLCGNGCLNCYNQRRGDSLRYTTEQFIKKANKIHNNFYDYSLVKYINAYTKVMIICPKHGIFKQRPGGHLFGQGCLNCVDHGKNSSFNWLEFYKNDPKGKELGHYYVLRLFNENELFIKRGITSNSIKKRFGNNLPYEYEIIEDIIMTNYETAQKEVLDVEKYKHLKYSPKIKFAGSTECYIR